jgi:hypothetical protein
MAADILIDTDAAANFTQTLAALAAAAARQSDMIDNTTTRQPAALFGYDLQSGAAAPVAGAIYEIFLIRGVDSGTAGALRDDNAGTTDAAITIENSQLVGTLVVTATANKHFTGLWTTANLGVLGRAFGSAVRNSTSQALNGTEGNHKKTFMLYNPRSEP